MKKSQVPSSFFSGWDSDMASLLLLVYLLPPLPSNNKGTVKISVRDAVDRVVKFHKVFFLHQPSEEDTRIPSSGEPESPHLDTGTFGP
ncbi:hypothetical protein KUCAC02_002914 [Chaenocephalus aceratus]|uniref:Uncharacterized protein n=1 Tax=Chaenocephalus aceratus TaxID=36190 RepID=A0ACB9WJE5_CHAAC|nr:hypothetical protein KUCAC02_002914 [Chaenocephalus aceratus]